jgi:predicted RNase H-like HicB family nuclease
MATKTYNFKVMIEPDSDFDGNPSGFHAYAPALETLGGSTWGATEAEALKNINEVIHMIVEELTEEGTPIPEGPEGAVEVEEVSGRQPRIVVTV